MFGCNLPQIPLRSTYHQTAWKKVAAGAKRAVLDWPNIKFHFLSPLRGSSHISATTSSANSSNNLEALKGRYVEGHVSITSAPFRACRHLTAFTVWCRLAFPWLQSDAPSAPQFANLPRVLRSDLKTCRTCADPMMQIPVHLRTPRDNPEEAYSDIHSIVALARCGCSSGPI